MSYILSYETGTRFEPAHLELVLLAAQVGALLLPEVVRLDDEGGVDAAPELVLQHLNNTNF